MARKKASKSETKETCSRCGLKDYAVGLDRLQSRFCKCGNVWAPKSEAELKLQEANETIEELKAHIEALECELQNLKDDSGEELLG